MHVQIELSALPPASSRWCYIGTARFMMVRRPGTRC
jgi:hypothetical protein